MSVHLRTRPGHVRLRRVLLVVGCLLLVVIPASVARGQDEVLYAESFDSGEAPGWELGPGWEVIPFDGGFVLAGSGHDWASPPPDATTFPNDYQLHFRLYPVAGRVHLNYRLSATGRYFIGVEQGSTNLNKQLWEGGFEEGLATGGIPFSMNTWHEVEIGGMGNRIWLVIDGVMLWEYADPDPLPLPSSFAFETLEDSTYYIDDIVVVSAGGEGMPDDAPAPPPEATTPSPPAGGAALSTEAGWVRTGGPIGGLGYDIRMRSDNPDILYVTDAWAGVFMSTDGGQTWVPANNGITARVGRTGDAIPVFCLTIDPHNQDILWAGTQNVRGIFRSADGGQNWVEMDNGVVEQFGITVRGITVDPQDASIVYAAAELSSETWAGQSMPGREFDRTAGVVYRTTDGGQNWSAIWRGQNLARYVWVDPRNSNVIYISTGIFDREAANSDPTAGTPGGEGILKSTDGGQTWQAMTNGLDNLYTGTLFMHPTNPDILIAGAHNNQYYENNGVYITTDGGQTWQHTLTEEGYGADIESVEFATSDPQIAYAGGSASIYRSSDGGFTWEQVSGGPDTGWGAPGARAGFPIDFQVDPRNPDRIFANNYGGGNFLSEDGGRTWSLASQGYTGAQVRGIAVDPTDPARVYAAARSGIFTSADGGGTWTGLNTPPASVLEWYAVAIDPTNPRHVLAANNWQGTILQSFDGGTGWQHVTPRVGEGQAVRIIAFAPSDSNTVYAGVSSFYSAGTLTEDLPAGGIWVSHDSGSTWAASNDALSTDANVIDLAVAPDDPNRVYAATANHDLLVSSDGGTSWQSANLNLPQSPVVLSVAVNPADSGVIFAGLWREGILRSTDGGASWGYAGIGLPPESVIADIVIDPANPQTLYISDRLSGIYRSTDGGNTWTAINSGLLMRDVNALAISADGQSLYAATEGAGVFRLYTPSAE